MDNLNLISNFAEFKELKNIDKSTMIGVLEDVFRHALQKQYETDENFDVIINPEKGDLEIWRNRTVVADGEVENPNAQIAVSEVKAIDPTYEVGDEYVDPIKLESFGLFKEMINTINTKTVSILMRGQIPMRDPQQVKEAAPETRQDYSRYRTQKEQIGGPQQHNGAQPNAPQQRPEPVKAAPKTIEMIYRSDILVIHHRIVLGISGMENSISNNIYTK